MIRTAKIADLAAVGDLVRAAWNESQTLPVNEDKLRCVVHKYMSGANNRVFVSDVDGVKGMLAASIAYLDIADGLVATDQCFYCKTGEGKQLIDRSVEWAKKRNCSMINMCVSSGNERSDKLIESQGFTRAGGNFYLVEGSNVESR